MSQTSDFRRILVVQPSWVGDAVLATPTLRALREQYPKAHIAYLARRYVKPVFTGMPWWDQLITFRTGKTRSRTGKGMLDLAARLRSGNFDLAVLLPNSFKTALLCRMAGIKRRVGYERDGRSFLLTDRLLPAKHRGKFVPTPMVKYYMGIAQYLGAKGGEPRMELFVTPSERKEAQRILTRCGLDPDLDRPGRPTSAAGGSAKADRGDKSEKPGPLVILNPGAQYGDAKCWLPEYFAETADRLIERYRATVMISGTGRERRILDAVHANMRHSAIDLVSKGLTLGALKDLVRRSDLMITNDTGPRHIAAAFGVPVITIFGPTHPEWTEIDFKLERKVSIPVFCGPCQKKKCPLDHRCMTGVTPAMVLERAEELAAE